MKNSYSKRPSPFNFKINMILFAFLLLGSNMFAQTDFALGEIAFTGYQSDTPDKASIVFLKDVEAGTTFQLTDNGWLSTGGLRPGEGITTVTINSALPCGTEVELEIQNSTSIVVAAGDVKLTDGSVVGAMVSDVNSISLSTGGDQLLIYQGSTTPSMVMESDLITGIQMNGNWDTNATSSNTSAKPGVFTDGVNSISISPEIDNAAYICGNIGGTPAEIAAAVNTFQGASDNPNAPPATWNISGSAGLNIPAECTFMCNVCSPPTITCPADNMGLADGCNPVVPAPDITAPVVENGCGTVTVTHEGDVTMDLGCMRTVTRTYRATDENGDMGECTQTFTFTFDMEMPTLSAMPMSTTVECDAIPAAPEITATDNCGDVAQVVFINEFHYDDDGGDEGEFIEVAGSANFDLSNCQLVLYNGNGGMPYSTLNLSGMIDNEAMGFGAVSFAYPVNGIQNGKSSNNQSGEADGIALVCNGEVIEFISYEGTLIATGGPANGMTSVDIGVEEAGEAPGNSLKRVTLDNNPAGCGAMDFVWSGPSTQSPGDINLGQSFSIDACPGDNSVDVMFSEVSVPGDCPQENTITRTWTATDACGNVATHTQTITVEDNTPPTLWNTPENITVSCEIPEAPVVTVVDNCDNGGNGQLLWVNEIHYDNQGNDVGEFIEIAGAGGINLDGYQLVLYNGDGDASYNTLNLSGVIPAESCGYGALAFSYPQNGLQNGNPGGDGIALTRGSQVIEFISYEGTLTAVDGPAAGMTSINIGVAESNSTTMPGNSLQLTGTAASSPDFTWNPPAAESPGSLNEGQLIGSTTIEVMFSEVGTPDPCVGGSVVRTWSAEDACGNPVSQTQIILLTATPDPTIVCPGDMMLSCEEEIATNVDDALTTVGCDGMGVVTVSDPVIEGDEGCNGTTYTFTYTVTDPCGRTATCEQVFTLDNAAPTVMIPADATVECAADIVVSTDDMTVVQDCPGELTLSVNGPVINGPANCTGTTYTYTYRAIDDCGRVVDVNRVFTIGENDAPTITAPVDYEVTCLGGSAPNPAWATFTTACDNGVAAEVTVSGPVVLGAMDCPGTTYTYTFTVTDACGRSASDTQTLTVVNEGPQLTCPAPLQVFGCLEGGYNDKIEAWIETVEATSSCGVDLTVNNNFNGNAGICLGNNFTTVTFSTIDACGRFASCEGTIAITDTDPPIIYAEPQEMLVPCTGNTQQIFSNWLATQGGAQATDACWGDQVSWSASVSPNALNCSNGPQAFVVTFTATDGCGNSATTVGIFNTKLLPNQINVSGLIQREDSEPVAGVQVGAYLGGGLPEMDMSDNGGDYAFPELTFDEDTEIVPEKNDDPLNGVSTLDLILLQQHILSINELNSPYKRIAADVNRSGNISTLDMVMLRRLILQIDEEFMDNTSWRFVDADYVFPNPQNPFANEFPEVYNVAGQEDEIADFIAVKIGDLNLDGETYGFGNNEVDDRNREDLNFAIEDQELIAGKEYRIEVNAQNFEQITGFQFTLNVENDIEVLDIEAGDLVNFNEQNFNLAKRENGAIPMSWNADRGQDLSGQDVAFSVIITANANARLSEVLSITSQYTKAEAYQNSALMNVNLTFNNNGQTVSVSEFKLFQNTPNPFKDATTIGFQLPEPGEVALEVYDVSGRLLFSETGAFATGYNQFELNRSDLPSGILYYQVNTADDSDSKKMILID